MTNLLASPSNICLTFEREKSGYTFYLPCFWICLTLLNNKKNCIPKYKAARENLICNETGKKNNKYKLISEDNTFAPIQYIKSV